MSQGVDDLIIDAKTETALKKFLTDWEAKKETELRAKLGLDRPAKTISGGTSAGGADGAFPSFSSLAKEWKSNQEAALRKYGEIEGAMLLPKEFTQTISAGYIMQKLAGNVLMKAGMFERSGAEGGALVPTQFIPQLQFLPLEVVNLRQFCTVIPVATSTVKMPRIHDTSHAAGSVFGGVQTFWESEGAALTTTAPNFGTVDLTMRKLTGYSSVTNELLADSPISVDTLLTFLFRAAMGWEENKKILRGSGVGEPLGILNSGATISVAKETGQAAATILYENITKMWSRLFPWARSRSIWIANPEVQPQLQRMALVVGLAGSAVYLPAGGLSAAPFDSLFGRPIVFTEHASALGTQGDIVLADMGMYLLGDRQQMSMTVSEHVQFATDQTAFRLIERLDGKPWLTSPITPANGGAGYTNSAFVMLDTRA
jgi:HK97 family phage major capsid protein